MIGFDGDSIDRGDPLVMYPGRKYYTAEQPFITAFINFADSLRIARGVIILGAAFRDNNTVEYILRANDQRVAPLPILVVNIDNIEPHFFRKIRDVRGSTHFHYARMAWRLNFIVGDYLDSGVRRQIVDFARDPMGRTGDFDESKIRGR